MDSSRKALRLQRRRQNEGPAFGSKAKEKRGSLGSIPSVKGFCRMFLSFVTTRIDKDEDSVMFFI